MAKKAAKSAAKAAEPSETPTVVKAAAKSMAKSSVNGERIEQRTQEIGHELFARVQHRSPSIFHGRWWEDRLMSWAMGDEAVKVQMFRFVDVLPMLKDHTSIARHLDEYFEEVRDHLPWAARLGLDLSTSNTILSRALAFNARTNAARDGSPVYRWIKR